MIARVLPVFGDYNTRMRQPRGYWLRNPASCREWNTPTGRAAFPSEDLPARTDWQSLTGHRAISYCGPSARMTSTTPPSTGSTTGIATSTAAQRTSATSTTWGWPEATGSICSAPADDGHLRVCKGLRLVEYDTPSGCIGGYYPELNDLVPQRTVGEGSFTPISKSVVVRMEKPAPMPDEEALVGLAGAFMQTGRPFLTELGPLILASAALGIAADTRALARAFDLLMRW